MHYKQYAPLSLTGEKEVIMVSLRGGSGTWRWGAAPSVSPVVGEWVGCEWLTQWEGAGGLEAASYRPDPSFQTDIQRADCKSHIKTLKLNSHSWVFSHGIRSQHTESGPRLSKHCWLHSQGRGPQNWTLSHRFGVCRLQPLFPNVMRYHTGPGLWW